MARRWTEAEIDAIHRRQGAVAVPTVAGLRPAERWPELANVFGAYLHQDFDIDGTAEQCVHLAVEGRDDAGRNEALANLEEFCGQGWGEEEVARAMDDLGMDYIPYADDRTHLEWLDWIVRAFRERG